MGNIQKYYENTKDALPNPMVRKFLGMNVEPQFAIDLGCGTGRDTICLIKSGWKVLAIDRENTSKIISSKLSQKEKTRFEFSCQNFENINLEKNNLLTSNFSLSFCNKTNFEEFWKKIVDSINKNRIFCWKFFWRKRFMEKIKRTNVFLIKRTSIKFI